MNMKRYIKRDIGFGNSIFTVLDELGSELYKAEKHKNGIVLLSNDGEKLLKIKALHLPKLCAYSITDRNNNIKFFMNPQKRSCYFYGTAWQVRGDVFSKSFDIIDADNSLVCAHEKSFSNGRSCYLVTVEKDYNELLCLGTALCVESLAHSDNLCVQTV